MLVTGTGTGVGKTVVAAAVAALASGRGERVAVVKPAQTGLPSGAPGDLAEIGRLAGVRDLHELARFPAALSPEAAGRLTATADPPTPSLARVAELVTTLAGDRELVLVEGAGGLLVRYAADGWTLADLARTLGAPLLVVTSAALGTLNHTALTLEAMERRGLRLAGGLVIGCWPPRPGLTEWCNVTDLAAVSGLPLGGALPAGLPALAGFAAAARRFLGPEYGGGFDAEDFAATARHGLDCRYRNDRAGGRNAG